MDPNAALQNMRDLIKQLDRAAEGDSNDVEIGLGHELAEQFQELDKWLASGGFQPDAWRVQGATKD